VNSSPQKWISRTTKRLAMIIVSPIPIYATMVLVCWSWYRVLKPTDGFYFDCCGHDAILPQFVLLISIILAMASLLVAPISLLLDWRRCKKNNP
jgi:hypothetical protein